jgi:regulator of RNase E activity RraA
MTAIRPLFSGRSFVAQAFTIEVRSVDDVAPRQALLQTWPRACIVIDARATPDNAVWGGSLVRIARQRDIAAVVVDGSVRDVADLQASGLAICSKGVTPRGPVWGGRVGGTIQCGGIEVRQGDLIVGDDDGVVVVPLSAVNDDFLASCKTRLAREMERGAAFRDSGAGGSAR